jgi:hypothetical protein
MNVAGPNPTAPRYFLDNLAYIWFGINVCYDNISQYKCSRSFILDFLCLVVAALDIVSLSRRRHRVASFLKYKFAII